MSKPKPKMLQEVSPRLLSPLFERGRLAPTHPASRRLRRKNHNKKMSKPKPKMLEKVSLSLLSPVFKKKWAQCWRNYVTQMSDRDYILR
ncbi:hypothetical protein L596_012894 [Steinernema carpocapsae]|uniref:Uncharacterized protein n=1 Tax=Steinernema carpocapsae TaxID=34508 RepID=A0A4U5NZ27_STECR|nr:hypothetical protein L596_012894 [Steinernema carpocapsae]